MNQALETTVTDTIEELELEEHIESHIQEMEEGKLYHVTFQEIENGNKRVVLSVEYTAEIGDLLDDESWEPKLNEVSIVSREGISPGTVMMILESLVISLDEDWFDSEDEDDSDDETIVSQPSTPPPSRDRRA